MRKHSTFGASVWDWGSGSGVLHGSSLTCEGLPDWDSIGLEDSFRCSISDCLLSLSQCGPHTSHHSCHQNSWIVVGV